MSKKSSLGFYRRLNPAGRLGLWALPILVVVIALFFSLWEPAEVNGVGFPGLQRVSLNSEENIVRLGPEGRSPGELREGYFPPSKAVTEVVLQRLSELRATYKQLGPGLEVVAEKPEQEQGHVAHSLTALLSTYNLSQPSQPENFEGVSAKAPLSIYCSPNDTDLAYKFLSAIAPYINGKAEILVNSRNSPGRLKLFIHGSVKFGEGDVAVFE